MPAAILNEDARSKKTEKALYAAMFSLLRKTSFRKITIKGLCEEALVSRAAFYAHFYDKYDLLTHWLAAFWPKDSLLFDNYADTERLINCYVQENLSILRNLVHDADKETYDIFYRFLLSTIHLSVDRSTAGDAYAKNVILSNFFAGGLLSYLLWQVDNQFPSDVPPMNKHLYAMILELQSWPSQKG